MGEWIWNRETDTNSVKNVGTLSYFVIQRNKLTEWFKIKLTENQAYRTLEKTRNLFSF